MSSINAYQLSKKSLGLLDKILMDAYKDNPEQMKAIKSKLDTEKIKAWVIIEQPNETDTFITAFILKEEGKFIKEFVENSSIPASKILLDTIKEEMQKSFSRKF